MHCCGLVIFRLLYEYRLNLNCNKDNIPLSRVLVPPRFPSTPYTFFIARISILRMREQIDLQNTNRLRTKYMKRRHYRRGHLYSLDHAFPQLSGARKAGGQAQVRPRLEGSSVQSSAQSHKSIFLSRCACSQTRSRR